MGVHDMEKVSDIRVLIVDDEEAVRKVLAIYLSEAGFQTWSCSSTEEARELMLDNTFNVCIVDLRLPGLSGEDLILLSRKRYPHQRYIIHTGAITYVLSDQLRHIGMRPEHIFHKPVRHLIHMTKCIEDLARNREGQDALSDFLS